MLITVVEDRSLLGLTAQIAACADVRVVSVADVPADVLAKEKAIEMEKEDIKSKPENIRYVCAGTRRGGKAVLPWLALSSECRECS